LNVVCTWEARLDDLEPVSGYRRKEAPRAQPPKHGGGGGGDAGIHWLHVRVATRPGHFKHAPYTRSRLKESVATAAAKRPRLHNAYRYGADEPITALIRPTVHLSSVCAPRDCRLLGVGWRLEGVVIWPPSRALAVCGRGLMGGNVIAAALALHRYGDECFRHDCYFNHPSGDARLAGWEPRPRRRR